MRLKKVKKVQSLGRLSLPKNLLWALHNVDQLKPTFTQGWNCIMELEAVYILVLPSC